MLNDLFDVIDRIPIKFGVADSWRWRHSSSGVYSTNEVYEWLRCGGVNQAGEENEAFRLIWNKLSPARVKIHSWRTIWERLPTRVELRRRNVIQASGDVSCLFCVGHEEGVRHIFFECNFAHVVWMECCKWLGVQTALSSNPSTSLLQFSKFLRGKKGSVYGVCI